jgi:hypothetical protein
MKASTSPEMNGETMSLSRNQSLFSIRTQNSKYSREPVVRHFEIHDLSQVNFSMIYRLEEDPSSDFPQNGTSFRYAPLLSLIINFQKRTNLKSNKN